MAVDTARRDDVALGVDLLAAGAAVRPDRRDPDVEAVELGTRGRALPPTEWRRAGAKFPCARQAQNPAAARGARAANTHRLITTAGRKQHGHGYQHLRIGKARHDTVCAAGELLRHIQSTIADQDTDISPR